MLEILELYVSSLEAWLGITIGFYILCVCVAEIFKAIFK